MSDARTVLIVEDDVAFADFLRAAVESVGHRAFVVTNATEALPAFEEHRPDLMLIDLLLPQGDGFEVCKSVRAHEQGADVPVVLMTGIYKKASYERQGLQDCQANEYVHKPFGVQALWRMLEKHLGAVTGDAEPERPTESFDLGERPLVDILAEHVENDSNGVLFVRSRSTTYAVYLQWGEPVFIRSNDPTHRLHEVLQRSGQVTAKQVEDALQAVAESRGKLRLGQALVRRGTLTEDQFQVALQLQLRLILQHAFQLTEGTCSFVEGSHPTEEDVHLAIRPKALLLLGAKSTGTRAVVAASLPSDDAPLSRSGQFDSLQEELALKGPERALARLVDGVLTVGRFRAIAESAGGGGTALLHGFMLTGLLSAGEPKETTKPGPSSLDWDATRFAQLPVAAAIADLHRIGACGTLEVRAATQGPAKRLVFRHGEIAAVQSDVEEDRLSDMLVRLRLIPESGLNEIMATFGSVEPDDRALARAIVTSGRVLPLQVYWAAVYQAQAAVHGLFEIVGAKLTWNRGEEPLGTVALPDMPTSEIVLGAVRSLAGATMLALLPPKTAWLRRHDDAQQRVAAMPLNDDERALLERLQEPVQLSDLLAEQPQAKAETRRRIFALLSCRLACESAAPATANADAEEVFEVLADEGESFLDMLHEDGFATGKTGQQEAVAAAKPEPAPIEVSDTAEPSEALFDLGFDEEEDEPHLEPATETESGQDTLAAQGRELLGRLAAGRVAVDGDEGGLEAHREALAELLEQCEKLVRRVIEETGEPAVRREAVPAGSGEQR